MPAKKEATTADPVLALHPSEMALAVNTAVKRGVPVGHIVAYIWREHAAQYRKKAERLEKAAADIAAKG